ncbi:hypothetical protein BC831DRAFT_484315 [Entophlyctis helioformis]|nr:hypothetical protein BC831DRAFT_484315 [Entophlyctis helioformis]
MAASASGPKAAAPAAPDAPAAPHGVGHIPTSDLLDDDMVDEDLSLMAADLEYLDPSYFVDPTDGFVLNAPHPMAQVMGRPHQQNQSMFQNQQNQQSSNQYGMMQQYQHQQQHQQQLQHQHQQRAGGNIMNMGNSMQASNMNGGGMVGGMVGSGGAGGNFGFNNSAIQQNQSFGSGNSSFPAFPLQQQQQQQMNQQQTSAPLLLAGTFMPASNFHPGSAAGRATHANAVMPNGNGMQGMNDANAGANAWPVQQQAGIGMGQPPHANNAVSWSMPSASPTSQNASRTPTAMVRPPGTRHGTGPAAVRAAQAAAASANGSNASPGLGAKRLSGGADGGSADGSRPSLGMTRRVVNNGSNSSMSASAHGQPAGGFNASVAVPTQQTIPSTSSSGASSEGGSGSGNSVAKKMRTDGNASNTNGSQ